MFARSDAGTAIERFRNAPGWAKMPRADLVNATLARLLYGDCLAPGNHIWRRAGDVPGIQPAADGGARG